MSKLVSFKHHHFTAAVVQMVSSFGLTLLTSLMKLPSVSMQNVPGHKNPKTLERLFWAKQLN